MNHYLFVGGCLSGAVHYLPKTAKIVNIHDNRKKILTYKKVSLTYGNKLLKIFTYELFTPNGEQTHELLEEFKRQLPKLLEKIK